MVTNRGLVTLFIFISWGAVTTFIACAAWGFQDLSEFAAGKCEDDWNCKDCFAAGGKSGCPGGGARCKVYNGVDKALTQACKKSPATPNNTCEIYAQNPLVSENSCDGLDAWFCSDCDWEGGCSLGNCACGDDPDLENVGFQDENDICLDLGD
jgi:hypothetical protein